MVVNLGHSGNYCPSPAEPQRILVIDLSGHHTVCVRFCKCSKSGFLESFRQLLRVSWYPASVLRPHTVFTFDLLDTDHKVSLQGKLNLYDFYNAIMQKTDNHGGSKPKVWVFLSVAACNSLSVPNSIGTTKCHGVYGNGVTLRTSSEVPRATQLPQSTNLVMGLSLLNVLLAPIQDVTYLSGGILNFVNARESSNLLHK